MSHKTAFYTTPALLLCASMLCMGCDDPKQTPTAPDKTENYAAETEKYDSEAHNPIHSIVLSDQRLYPDRSGERIIGGDIRPLYVAEGRVKSNLMHSNADEIVIRVYLEGHDQKSIIDTADIVVKNIPPDGIRAFRQKIQLLPPRGEHPYMEFEVESVKTSPIRWPSWIR